MAQPRVSLIGGGARSGKSRFALSRALELGTRRVFVATAEARDAEMHARIARHRDERSGEFDTLEAPRDLVPALQSIDAADVVVIDCLTLWLSNLLEHARSEAEVEAEVARLGDELSRRRFHALVVTNEVGLGIVPDNALARLFRDVAGRAHQQLAEAADEVYFAALGQMLRLKPAPVEAVSFGSTT